MSKPNVLVILTDQQRYDSLGCDGNPHARTPNLDALAEGGTVFTQHIASNPVCMPSRAGLCTGLLPSGHGVWNNGVPLNRTGDFGPPECCRVPGTRNCPVAVPLTIADVFAAGGYDTAAFGKLHLTPNLIEAIQANGLWEHTIVVFTSDHEEYLGDHGLVYKSPTGVDSLLRVPFLLRAPGVELPPAVHSPMSNCDVLPTLASLCGLEPPANIDGVDILPVVREGREHLAFAQCFDADRTRNNTTLYTDRYRFTLYPGADHAELYDHREDFGEANNIAPGHPDLVAEFRRKIEQQTLRSMNLIVHRLCPW